MKEHVIIFFYIFKSSVKIWTINSVLKIAFILLFFSGGQRRKLSVGVALLALMKMIILDEPTAGIDPRVCYLSAFSLQYLLIQARRDIWELILGVRKHSQSAIMLTSHSMDECEALCSRIAVLNRGKLIAIGESQTLKSL